MATHPPVPTPAAPTPYPPVSNKMRDAITSVCTSIMALFLGLIIVGFIGVIIAESVLFVYQCIVLANNVDDNGCGGLYGTLLASVIIRAIVIGPFGKSTVVIVRNQQTGAETHKQIDNCAYLMFILIAPFVMSCILISTYNKLENDATCHDYWFDNHRMFYDVYYLTYIDAIIGIALFSIIFLVVLTPLMCMCCIACNDICRDICCKPKRNVPTQYVVQQYGTVRRQPAATQTHAPSPAATPIQTA